MMGRLGRISVLLFSSFLLLFSVVAMAGLDASKSLRLLGQVEITSAGVQFGVESHGCTQAKHFRAEIRDHRLTLVRTRSDFCRRMPFRVRVTVPITRMDAGDSEPFYLVNPIQN